MLAGHEIRKHIALANDLPLSQAVAHPDWNLVEFARLKGKALYALGRTIQEPQAGTLPAEGVGIIFIENVVEDPGNNPSRFYIGPPPASSVRFVDDFESD